MSCAASRPASCCRRRTRSIASTASSRALGDDRRAGAAHLGLCEDEAVIGTAFYVMEYVEGRVFWDPTLPGMSARGARAHLRRNERVIAALHKVDPRRSGSAITASRATTSRARSIAGAKQYRASEDRADRGDGRLIEWLPANVPAGDETTHRARRLPHRQHGLPSDRAARARGARLGAVHARPPARRFRLPLHDWRISAPRRLRGLAGVEPRGARHPHRATSTSRRTAGARGARASSRAHWEYYLAYNMFRLAAILQGVHGARAAGQRLERATRSRPAAQRARSPSSRGSRSNASRQL